MTNKQTPLLSGFSSASTADEVLAGINLTGKLAIVTGGHSGLGLETTRALSRAGASVLILARNPLIPREAVAVIPGVEVDQLDLADLGSVRDFVERFVATGRKMDMVINNAAIMACPQASVGDGWESQFGTNHLGHFALINLLWPAIAPGARIVAVSSAGHHLCAMRWDDIQMEADYEKWLAYGQSKTAIALFALHLNKLAASAGVKAFSIHPGKIISPLQRHLAKKEMVDAGWIDEQGNVVDPTFKTPEQGAATQVWAATSSQLDDLGGQYCEDCDVSTLTLAPRQDMAGVCAYAVDEREAARLWQFSAQLTGINAFVAAE
ncbi:oxidoreductase [Pseudomonas avellanae]|uniref:Probable oxidoreductase n=2 Tax=Pseudomonas syringae group TaxID=136849 RepID=A0A261WNW5_9PSED|nr:SDR family NAD(P)-dependent oxidoreductase [Pseudomonas syringae]OZI87650.1 oxidoreductase [Pseudomonas avellanae]ATV17934.1 oxidoreductase [Pseudomonas syringae pv. actinidiae]NYS42197.1 SDR family NAD(P)-dependent oxidoreductase [Pseudomonas syringae pv. actinidiae]PIN59375.1 oxidoreductase [Pseudomonas syringae pv. actinidiae]GAO93203.1 hypothetical protein PSA5_10820 [Pseudomonas syringae pv. actinidiae]